MIAAALAVNIATCRKFSLRLVELGGHGGGMTERVEVEIEDLLLDHENPRLGTVESQPEALRELVELSPRNFAAMMESIKINGLDPGDLFYLVDESEETGIEGYTVVDGNRRCAALKVLMEPALLAGAGLADATIKRLRSAADGFDSAQVGDQRLCVLFGDREEADAWILRRHGTGQEGVGRIAWGPLEIQRFQGDRSVLDILDFMGRNGGYDSDVWAGIRSKLDKRSSVLRRFLESKAGRDALGLDEETVGEAVRPTSHREPKYLVTLLTRLLNDVVSGAVNTRTYNKASEIQRYFDELPAELNAANAASGDPTAFHDLNIAESPASPGSATTQAPKTPQTRAPRLRETLAPKLLEFKQPVNAKGAQFVREATRIKLKDAPLGAAFLLRGFIQFVVDSYIEETEGLEFWEEGVQLDLSVRAVRVIDHLIANRKAKRGDLSGIKRRLTEKANKHPSSIQALNDYHHDRYQIPDADTLRSGWDDATALFVAVLGRPGQ